MELMNIPQPTIEQLQSVSLEVARLIHDDAVLHGQELAEYLEAHRTKASALGALAAPSSIAILLYSQEKTNEVIQVCGALTAAGLVMSAILAAWVLLPVQWCPATHPAKNWFYDGKGPRDPEDLKDEKLMLALSAASLGVASDWNAEIVKRSSFLTTTALLMAAASAFVGFAGILIFA